MRRLALVLVLAAGCSVDLALPDRVVIACQPDGHCPGDLACDVDLGLCVRQGDDRTAPALVGAMLVDPAVGRAGTRFLVTLTFDEPLLLAPDVAVEVTGGTEALELQASGTDRGAKRYVYSFVPDGGEGEQGGALSVVATDFAGNQANLTGAALVFDFTSPTLRDLQWETSESFVPRASTQEVMAEVTGEVDLDQLELLVWDTGGALLGEVGLETPEPTGVEAYHLTATVDIPLFVAGDQSVIELELAATDAVGNRASARSSPLEVDGLAPDATIVPPPDPARDRTPEIAFATSAQDVDRFECRFDAEPFAPCESPVAGQLVGNGVHSLEVSAIDRAGNRTDPPARVEWTVEPVWKSVSAGEDVLCALGSDASIWCWGENDHGGLGLDVIATRPEDRAPNRFVAAHPWATVSPGESGGCAIRDDTRELWCWGSPGPQLGMGPITTVAPPRPVAVAGVWDRVDVHHDRACGIQGDGALYCWGSGNDGGLGLGDIDPRDVPTRVGEGSDWIDVTVGYRHVCGIRAEATGQRAYCWGDNTAGLLGTGDLDPSSVPKAVAGDFDDWQTVDAGFYHTCGLRAGEIWCWGDADYVGDVDGVDHLEPQQVGSASDWVAVDTSIRMTCGRRAATGLWCWGTITDGRLRPGDPELEVGPVPTPVGEHGEWVDHAVGVDLVCAITAAGELSCWGKNRVGQLGLGRIPVETAPVSVDGATWLSVASGPFSGSTRCGIRADGSLWCWGDRELEASRATNAPVFTERVNATPQAIGSDTDWLSLSVGHRHRCGIRGVGPVGTLWCWGGNPYGEIGVDPATAYLEEPAQVGSDADWEVVAAGGVHTCGVRVAGSDRTIHCWGHPGWGRLGVEDPVVSTFIATPTPVLGGVTDWLSLESGGDTTCALRDPGTGGELWCWGYMGWGTAYAVPTKVDLGADDWLAASVSSGQLCGLRGAGSGGELWCTNLCWNWPCTGGWQQIGTGDDWVTLETGGYQTCGFRLDGSLWCFGSGSAFFAPDLTGELAMEPWMLPGDWDAFDTGAGRSICTLAAGGTLQCWGENRFGQLGTGEPWGPGWVVMPQ